MSKKTNKSVVVIKELSESELQKLAHEGTKEAIDKIEKYIKAEPDYEKRSYAEIALGECEMFYYQPRNEKEEEDFLLSELIRRRENHIDDLYMKIENIESNIEKLMLEKKVHEKVLSSHKNKKEEWKYNWMQDFVTMEENKIAEIKDDLAYDEAWVAEAKKIITTTRYRNMPLRHLEHYDFNMDHNYENDTDCDCDEGCCENE
ncbi:MAG: hypothetical protein WCV59_04700 [Parcubacteria group bacterium]|jgi:hypothetical protein